MVSASFEPQRSHPTVVLEIAGQQLQVRAHNADAAHLQRLAAIVNERVEAQRRVSNNPRTVLVLAALDLADEVLSCRHKLEAVQEEARRAVALAEERARQIEQMARQAIAAAIEEIDRTLARDQEPHRKRSAETTESETA